MKKTKTLTKFAAAAAMALAVTGTAQKAQAQDPFIATIQTFGFNFCPRGWIKADGQLLPIANYTAVFSLVGTYYGGDGRTTFGVPDLRGRVAINWGQGPGLTNYAIGQRGGVETVILTTPQIPSHNHMVNVTNARGDKLGPRNDFMADPPTILGEEVYGYHDGPANGQMDPGVISNTGGNLSHENRPPYLALTTCFALEGIYPSRS